MRPGTASALYSTWFGPGVMQIAHGAPETLSGSEPPHGRGLTRRARWRHRRRFHRLLASAQRHQHSARWIELDQHVRPFVGRPQVAILVEPHRVREGKTVEILADFADVRAVGAEL